MPTSLPTQPAERTESYQVDLGGIISLLSQHLYSQGPDVVVRELLQNGIDAITKRREPEPSHQGRIEVECQADPDSGGYTLVVSDNGAGIDAEEINRALGTIGFSFKRDARDAAGDSAYIGQFGVGLLSGFMVAPQIHVLSKKADSDAPAFHWTGDSRGHWGVRSVESDLEPGTRVYLHLDTAGAARLPAAKVPDLLRHFGEFLPAEICFRDVSGEVRIDQAPFWKSQGEPRETSTLGKRFFGEDFLTTFSFFCPITKADGIAFVSDRETSPGDHSRHRLYVRNMLVSESIRDLAPSTAPFLRCALNADRLRINAAREDLHGDETRRRDLQKAIADGLDSHLRYLRNTDVPSLVRLLTLHYETLLRSAETNDLHLELLAGHLSLHTTLGPETAAGLVRKAGEILHIGDEIEYARIELRAIQEGIAVVRSNTLFSHRLLGLIERRLPELKVRETSAGAFLKQFDREGELETPGERHLLAIALEELKSDHCKAGLSAEDDPFSPATLILDDEDSIFRNLFAGMGLPGDNEPPDPYPKELRLNRSHPVVASLLDSPDMADDQIRAWIRVFYHHALLAARERPSVAESRKHARALVTLWNTGWNPSPITSTEGL